MSQVNMIISCIKTVVEAITGFNECVTFSQWFRSLGSGSEGTAKQEIKKDDELKLQDSFHGLQETLPAMYEFIDRVEWRSHEKRVAELLPKLKAAVYDADDLLEDFRCYQRKVKIEGTTTSLELGSKFFQDLNTKLTAIKNRLDNQAKTLKRLGLNKATLRFDRSFRPETTRYPNEAKIFGRDDEIKELIRLLDVHANNRRSKRKISAMHSSTSNQVCAALDNNKATPTVPSIPVLPIVGIGGVGKTTLAQNICNHPQVKSHFNKIAWICVSDDFDVKRLTKDAIEQFSQKATTKDSLDLLFSELAECLKMKRFLIVLDDMWAEEAELWKTFYSRFEHVVQGSMMLVTTRSPKVADIVRTTNPFLLEGLKDNVFKEFFELCVFGSDGSKNNPELKQIAEQILPKLKGTPLAAKTLGRLLGMSFDPAHWNMILNSQLWEHKQEATEIMPALRLSYIYLPFHLKRCFSFCAVYPKDYRFEKEDLAEVWVAEGFVEAEHNIPLQQIACKYFEELEYLSFFQKLRGKYVIHDLIHDMAQLVSKDECFIIKEKNDLDRIPQNIRHLSVLKSEDVDHSDLENLCKYTKLRTILCDKSLKGPEGNNVMEKWCAELLCLRLMVCASISESGLPDSISNMKNLRYLKISDDCSFDSLPAAFCLLYNLRLLSAKKCIINVIPKDFSNLINLQKFESEVLKIDAGLLNNFELITGKLHISNLCEISEDQAAKIEVMKKRISHLALDWSSGIFQPVHNVVEVFQALHPPTNIKCVSLYGYPGEYLPSWFHGFDGPATIFSLLTVIKVENCPSLSSLEQFLQPAYMPAIKRMVIKDCTSLKSVPVERFGGFSSLEELEVSNCPKINSKWEDGIVLPLSLQKLRLNNCGYFPVGCMENLTSLKELIIKDCEDLVSIGAPEGIAHIPNVWIENCPKLKEVQQPPKKGY